MKKWMKWAWTGLALGVVLMLLPDVAQAQSSGCVAVTYGCNLGGNMSGNADSAFGLLALYAQIMAIAIWISIFG